MRLSRKSQLVLAAVVLLALLPVQPAQAAPVAVVDPVAPPTALPVRQIVIKYKAGTRVRAMAEVQRQLTSLGAAAGVSVTYLREMSGGAHVVQLPAPLPAAEVAEIAARMAANSADIAFAEPDYVHQVLFVPNDPYYVDQWHLQNGNGIQVEDAWGITTGASNLYVAVVDTGVVANHPDLAERTTVGYDLISDPLSANDGGGRDADATDPGDWRLLGECAFPASISPQQSTWHGSHVAGTIAAKSNNGRGVAGINWVSKVVPVRVIGKCGGTDSDVADGIRWAAGLNVPNAPTNAHPARVINMSLGGQYECSTAMQSAVTDARAAGSVVVVAAGNGNIDASGFSPASCAGVITVAASNRSGGKAQFAADNSVGSNFGSVVEISAPGGEAWATRFNGILSTLDVGKSTARVSTYAWYQGTSMAAPHVAGVVSLMLSANPNLTPNDVQQILQQTVTNFPVGSTCNTGICGSGIVNAGAAVREAQRRLAPNNPTPTPLPTRMPAPTPSASGLTCPNGITNGSFEGNVLTAWDTVGDAVVESTGARTGTQVVRLGNAVITYATLQSKVGIAVPSDVQTSTLSFWYQISTEEFNLGAYDFLHISLWDAATNEILADIGYRTNLSATTTWTPVTRTLSPGELSAIAGKSVKLQFEMENGRLFVTRTRLDDVTWSLCTAGSGGEPTATATTSVPATATSTPSVAPATATSTALPTPSATASPTFTPTATSTPAPTATPTGVSAASPTPTSATATIPPTATPTSVGTASQTPTPRTSSTATATPTSVGTALQTPSPPTSSTATATSTSGGGATATATATAPATTAPTSTPTTMGTASPTPTTTTRVPTATPILTSTNGIVGPVILLARNSGMLVVWTSVVPTTATVRYGPQAGVYGTPVVENGFSQNHIVALPALPVARLSGQAVSVYLKITQIDSAGRQYASDELVLTLPPPNEVYMPLLTR